MITVVEDTLITYVQALIKDQKPKPVISYYRIYVNIQRSKHANDSFPHELKGSEPICIQISAYF